MCSTGWKAAPWSSKKEYMFERKWWFNVIVQLLAILSTAFLLDWANVSVRGHGVFSAEFVMMILCIDGLQRAYRKAILFTLNMLKPQWGRMLAD